MSSCNQVVLPYRMPIPSPRANGPLLNITRGLVACTRENFPHCRSKTRQNASGPRCWPSLPRSPQIGSNGYPSGCLAASPLQTFNVLFLFLSSLFHLPGATLSSPYVACQSWRSHAVGCFWPKRELIHRTSSPACLPKTIRTDLIDIPQLHKRHAQRSKYSSSSTPSKMRHANPTNYSSHAPHPSSRPYSLSTHPRWSHHQRT